MLTFKLKLPNCSSLCKWRRSYVIKNVKKCEITDTNIKNETKEPLWKRRYNVALYGFFIYFLQNAHRMNMSVAIVAMVELPNPENDTMQRYSNTSSNMSGDLLHDQPISKYNWSPEVQGYILGAGFLGYVLSLVLGGKLAETFGPGIVLFTGTFISSFSTMITPFTASVNPHCLIFVQFIRGIAQGFMLPAMTVLSANWFPSVERGLLSGLSFSGFVVGLLMAGYLSSLICDNNSIGGWPVVFYTFGGFGILVSLLQIFVKSLPRDDAKISEAELTYILKNQESKLTAKRPAVPWRKILCNMPTYALFIALFGQYWILFYFMTLHATFLAAILHYPMNQTGILISTPYLLGMIVSISTSFLSSYFRAKHLLSVTTARKLWNFTGCAICSLCFALMIFTSSEHTVTVLSSAIGTSCIGFMLSSTLVVALDMTPTFAGSLMALSTTVASLSGFILPVVCGVLTNEEQSIKQWNKLLIISIVVIMSSATFFCVFGSADIQSYNTSADDLCLKTEKETKFHSKIVELKSTSEFSNHI